jgi:hypothetical protein
MNTRSTKTVGFLPSIPEKWRPVLLLVYALAILTIVILIGVDKVYKNKPPEPVAPAPVVVSPTVDLQPLENRISRLESDLARHKSDNEKLEAENAALSESKRRLERRLQAQLEFNKRICEYIMVITVDKKIVPRQCLPEYKWQREEGQ